MNSKIISLGIIAFACICSWVCPQQSATITNLRVTDSEWTLLTNSYPSKLVTGPIEFYK
jgi:hypothetical protein